MGVGKVLAFDINAYAVAPGIQSGQGGRACTYKGIKHGVAGEGERYSPPFRRNKSWDNLQLPRVTEVQPMGGEVKRRGPG